MVTENRLGLLDEREIEAESFSATHSGNSTGPRRCTVVYRTVTLDCPGGPIPALVLVALQFQSLVVVESTV